MPTREAMISIPRMTQVTALVLRAVEGGRRYGFDIMDACGLPSGTVYPALRRLEGGGLLKAHWEDASQAHTSGRPPRRMYTLTERGREALPDAERKLEEVRLLLGELPGTSTREA